MSNDHQQRDATDDAQADDNASTAKENFIEALNGAYSISELAIIVFAVLLGGALAAFAGVRIVGTYTTLWGGGWVAAGAGVLLVCLYTTVAFVALNVYWSVFLQVLAHWRTRSDPT